MKKLLTLVTAGILAIGLTACSGGSTDENSKNTDVSNTTAELAKDTTVTTENNIISNPDKIGVKSKIESLIPEAYKGKSYTCDILTPSEGNGFIVSIQLEENKFVDSEVSKDALVDIVDKMLTMDIYDKINTMDFSFVSSDKLQWQMDIKEPQSIKAKEDIRGSISVRC